MYLLFELCPQPLTLFALSLSRDSDFPGYTHHHHADDLPSVMPTTPSAIAAPSFVSLTLEPSAPPLISFSFFWVLCSDMRPTAQPQQFHVTVNVVATVIVVVESKVQSTTVCCACECVCMVGVASFFNTILFKYQTLQTKLFHFRATKIEINGRGDGKANRSRDSVNGSEHGGGSGGR